MTKPPASHFDRHKFYLHIFNTNIVPMLRNNNKSLLNFARSTIIELLFHDMLSKVCGRIK